jgi:hypothetical protein
MTENIETAPVEAPAPTRTKRRSVVAAVAVLAVLGITAGGAALHHAGVNQGKEQMREQSTAAFAEQSATIAEAAGNAAVERYRRAKAGVIELENLPKGVDRAAAAKAESDRKAFAYTANDGCSMIVRLPSGVVVDVSPTADETGTATAFGPSRSGCTGLMAPGWTPPPLSERASLWEAAIVGAKGYEYGDGGRNVHVDVSRCTGYVVPLPPTAAGVAVDPVTPSAGPNAAESCKGTPPGR